VRDATGESFGAAPRRFRELANLSQSQLAERVPISQGSALEHRWPGKVTTRQERMPAMGKHDPPKPPVDPSTDGQAPGIPKEPDPGKHGKK
jgi:hypothetical protein